MIRLTEMIGSIHSKCLLISGRKSWKSEVWKARAFLNPSQARDLVEWLVLRRLATIEESSLAKSMQTELTLGSKRLGMVSDLRTPVQALHYLSVMT
jgi:hypothetical protein